MIMYGTIKLIKDESMGLTIAVKYGWMKTTLSHKNTEYESIYAALSAVNTISLKCCTERRYLPF